MLEKQRKSRNMEEESHCLQCPESRLSCPKDVTQRTLRTQEKKEPKNRTTTTGDISPRALVA